MSAMVLFLITRVCFWFISLELCFFEGEDCFKLFLAFMF